ncbi:MAG TPA: nuclear transport factor 2 family protein [Stenotrophomonas sp.]|jgi:hypothetical protein
MFHATCLLPVLMLVIACPAHASWRPANPTVAEACKAPRIAAALAATERMDKAILSHDVPAFGAVFDNDAVVNNPFNTIARKADAENNLRTGKIDYTTLERTIEYCATRGDHDVVLMGEETLTPVNQARFAGKQVRRRTTEIWSDASGQWKLAVRQATIYKAD